MRAKERRREIAALLMSESKPQAGGVLAERFGVSRQIIVQDIAALKASGYEINATHFGYVLKKAPLLQREFKVKHESSQTEDELSRIIACGGFVADVFVWHRVYGKIAVALNLYSEAQVKQFIKGVRAGKSTELMHLTDGEHYHTVRADSEEILDAVEHTLREGGYLMLDHKV